MTAVGCDSYGDYLDFLEVHPEEFEQLFDTLLINVTELLPRRRRVGATCVTRCCRSIVARKDGDEPIRVWVAGCASGEEAYSVAMVLAEVLGPEDAYRDA